MTIKRITEIGVVVRDIDAATAELHHKLGAEPDEIFEVSRYKMKARMCRVGGIDFELMSPTGEDGVIADFLRKHGEGIHHIAFAVDDLKSETDRMSSEGVAFVSDAPARETFKMRDFAGQSFCEEVSFNFAHPSSFLGMLIEFIQYPAGWRDETAAPQLPPRQED